MDSNIQLTFEEYQDIHLTIQIYCRDHGMPPPTKHWMRHTIGVLPPAYHTWEDEGYHVEDLKKFRAAKLKYGF